MTSLDPFYKGSSAIVVIIVIYRLQEILKPYKLAINNECEILSFLGSGLLLFGGLLFTADIQRVASVDVCAFLVIMFVNIKFILLWLYLIFLSVDKYKYSQRIIELLRLLLFRSDDVDNLGLVRPPSMSTIKTSKYSRPTENIKSSENKPKVNTTENNQKEKPPTTLNKKNKIKPQMKKEKKERHKAGKLFKESEEKKEVKINKHDKNKEEEEEDKEEKKTENGAKLLIKGKKGWYGKLKRRNNNEMDNLKDYKEKSKF